MRQRSLANMSDLIIFGYFTFPRTGCCRPCFKPTACNVNLQTLDGTALLTLARPKFKKKKSSRRRKRSAAVFGQRLQLIRKMYFKYLYVAIYKEQETKSLKLSAGQVSMIDPSCLNEAP